MIDKEILLTEADPKFKEFMISVLEEFDRIRTNLPGIEIGNNPISPHNEYVIPPNLFSDFGQFDIEEFNPNVINQLNELLLIDEFPLHIYFDLDFSYYGIKIVNFYDKLFEETFLIYLFWNSTLPLKILSMINELRMSFKLKKMPINILIPLKGFYLPSRKEDNNHMSKIYNIQLKKIDEATQVALKNISNYSIINFHYNDNENKIQFVFEGINKQFSEFCINAKGNTDFKLQEYDPRYSYSYLWRYIEEVAQSLTLEGTLLRFGQPFYNFPWWISSETKIRFDFHYPEWMSNKFMNKNNYSGLVPDTESFSTTFFRQMRKYYEKGKQLWEKDFIINYGAPLNSEMEFLNELHSDSKFISNPDRIVYLFRNLNDNKSTINFKKDFFILDRFLKLSQREKIEDIILDVCIILETLLLYNIQDELSYRLKLNVSSLLAENVEEFDFYFNFFSELYKYRSAIIHGNPKLTRGYKNFVENTYPNLLEKLDINNEISKNFINKTIQYDIFKKICMVFNKLIDSNIDYRNDFKTDGFLKIFLKKEPI